MSDLYQSLSHSKWYCKYHILFIPKARKRVLYGKIRSALGPIFHELARQKGCSIIEGHMVTDHVHMCISIPPKFPVASIIGFIKGKSTIAIARQFCGKERNFLGEHFWARGYACLLYTSDAADDLLCVDIGGRRIIKKKKTETR